MKKFIRGASLSSVTAGLVIVLAARPVDSDLNPYEVQDESSYIRGE